MDIEKDREKLHLSGKPRGREQKGGCKRCEEASQSKSKKRCDQTANWNKREMISWERGVRVNKEGIRVEAKGLKRVKEERKSQGKEHLVDLCVINLQEEVRGGGNK